ncbi:response regulator [Paenibacillus sp. B-A-8]|uniref:response regulator n=1 Tax=Paenibacillus sp. B-A-8 TaxID=3400419 RepID=UPI003B02BB4B
MEDQEEKYQHIKEILSVFNPELVWKKSCQTGLMELMENKFDYLLLDMSMPICEDESSKENFDSYAGMYVLREIKRKRYDLKVIVVTGFDDFETAEKVITLDELQKEIIEKYDKYYIGYVRYDSTSVEWQHSLLNLLKLTMISENINENTNSR